MPEPEKGEDYFEKYRVPKCRNCGRPLKAASSIAHGFGPTCGQEWADRWLKARPTYLGERAKKLWTKEDIKKLMAGIKAAREAKARA